MCYYAEVEDMIGHSDTKIISDANLPYLVRQMAVHANVSVACHNFYLKNYFSIRAKLFVLCLSWSMYTVSQKNDNDVLRYNFNSHQPILIIFGRDIAEWICY